MRNTTERTNTDRAHDAAPPRVGGASSGARDRRRHPRRVTLHFLALVALGATVGVAVGTRSNAPSAPRGAPTFDEAISRSFTVMNRAGSTPVFTEGISRAFTVINRTGSTPAFDERISRAFTACNVAGLGDFDVNADDFREFGRCFTFGPDRAPPEPGWEVFDLDCDDDVDLADFAGFQNAFTAPP